MVRKFCPGGGSALAGACYVTAIFGGLVAHSLGQETLQKAEAREPLKYGPFDVLYGARASMVYDDNIYISTNKQSDVIWTLAPEVTLGAGDYRVQEGNFLRL